jgi:hypothetical protein
MKNLLLLCGLFILGSCATQKTFVDSNPPAVGFNAAASDPKAIAIADEVMKAMGGRRAWDNTKNLTWNFFGFRQLIWDKKTGNVRVNNTKANNAVIFNVNTRQGIAQKKGEIVTDSVERATLIEKAYKIWVNDSYWLVMPFKLKDSGVTLTYKGEQNNADVLQLTFESIGVTPENKYLVYVNKTTHLVEKWAFFRKNTDEKPEFENEWTDYKPFGKIMLSGNRGRKEGALTEIEVDKKLPKTFFEKF